MSPVIKPRIFIILFIMSLLLSVAGCGEKTDLSSLGNNLVCFSVPYNKGVYKSDNGGISWYPLVKDQEDIYLYSKKLFMSPDFKRLYVSTTGGGLFFVDMEKGVLNRVEEFKDEDVRSVEFRRSSNGQEIGFDVYAAKKETGIFMAVAGTDNWAPFNEGLAYRDVNALCAADGALFAGTINGVFKWDDSSGRWRDMSEGIINKNIISICADTQGKTVYAGAGAFQDEKGLFHSTPSLYKSADNGRTWEDSDRGLPGDVLVFSIAINPAKPERIYLGTSQGIYRSIDSGNKWAKTDDGLPDDFKALDIKIVRIPDEKALVYAAGASGIFMALDEEDQEWETRNYGIDKSYISSIIFPDSRQSVQPY